MRILYRENIRLLPVLCCHLYFFILKVQERNYTVFLRVGFRSRSGLQSDHKTTPSTLEMICKFFNGTVTFPVITIHCRHYVKSRFLLIQGFGNMSLPICQIKVYSGKCSLFVHDNKTIRQRVQTLTTLVVNYNCVCMFIVSVNCHSPRPSQQLYANQCPFICHLST